MRRSKQKHFTNQVMLRLPYIYGEYNYAQRESLIFRQLVENRDNIVFKANVDKNLYEIIAELSV